MLSMGSGARLGEHLKKYRDKQREEQRGHRLNDFKYKNKSRYIIISMVISYKHGDILILNSKNVERDSSL